MHGQFKGNFIMHGVRPKKFLGQHFLRDQNIAKKIVECLSTDNSVVLEVGPGTGVLTRFLIEKPIQEFILVEIDRESNIYLKKQFSGSNLKLVEEDFLQLDLSNYSNGNISIIGNFPYHISSQIFFKILDHTDQVEEVVCMVQKEVADRICSPPGNKVYGILSVLLGAYYDAKALFKVPPGVFEPPPKVQSAVMSLKRKKIRPDIQDAVLFKKIVKQSFQNRRKTLRNALKPIFLPEELTSTDLFNKRAEQLSVNDFIQLANTVYNWKN